MKQLLLIRHAEALPEKFPERDIDRGLSDHGRLEAAALGSFLSGKSFQADLLVCSSAIRTLSTAEILCNQSGISSKPQATEMLYNASYQTILQTIRGFPPEAEVIWLVGHNPGISQIATLLSNGNSYQFSTAAGLCLAFPAGSWQEITNGTGKELWYFSP